MNRLENKLKSLKTSSGKALVTYLTAGYPDCKETVKLAALFEKSGADILEIGVPFSDPIADGRSVQFASQTALGKGMTVEKVFGIVKDIRKRSEIPIVLMGYMNPFLRHGFENTMAQAKKSGVDGFIIPDIIPEESAELRRVCGKYGLSLIHLTAPNTPEQRLKFIDKASSGFVYVVSISGVTGARKALPGSTKQYLITTSQKIKQNPRIIGFGISSAGQVRELKKYVDGFIVASALIEIIRNRKNIKDAYPKLGSFIKSLRRELDKK